MKKNALIYALETTIFTGRSAPRAWMTTTQKHHYEKKCIHLRVGNNYFQMAQCVDDNNTKASL
jgi:hypothetical protein